MTRRRIGTAQMQTGTYVLVFNLGEPISNRLGTFCGRYCYVGSAKGPGGLRARLSRHLRRGKPLRWHIDLLTNSTSFSAVCVYASAQASECRVARKLSLHYAGHPRFGCSDCRCPTHLFMVQDPPRLEVLMDRMGLRKLDLPPLSSSKG